MNSLMRATIRTAESPASMSLLPQWYATTFGLSGSTRESISRFQSSVCAPSKAMLATGSGAICSVSAVQRWKMLLPTKTIGPFDAVSCA